MSNLDFPDWSEAKSFATEIAAIGAPLLRLTRNLGSQVTPATLNGGTFLDLFGGVPINQPGYEAQFMLNFPTNAGTNPFAQLTITWLDSVSGESVATDQFLMTGGNGAANALTYYISGPCKGDIVDFVLLNLDPAQQLSYTFNANVNSHIYTWDRMLQPAYGGVAPNGFTNPAGSPGVGVLAIMSPTQVPGNVSSRLVAVYNGKARINVDNLGQPNGLRMTLQDPNALYSPIVGGNLMAQIVGAGATFTSEIALPNGPVLLTSQNQGTTGNITPTLSIVKEEY